MDAISARQAALWALGLGSAYIGVKTIRQCLAWLLPAYMPGEPNTILLATPVVAGKEMASNIKEYDYVICGGGTTGCVLAARLSEDPKTSVLLIESGFSDLKQIFSRIPAGLTKLFHTAADWDIATSKQEHVNNRQLFWPRGKMLGGCSAMNALMIQRPAPDDLDEWERLGAKGWNFKSMVGYFQKSEGFYHSPKNLAIDDISEHGTKGPLKVSYSSLTDLGNSFIKACAGIGIPAVPDVNTKQGCRGVTRTMTSISANGERCSAAVAYLTSDVVSRPNLKIAVGQSVKRILFDKSGKRPKAVGVEMAASATAPVQYHVRARKEVIVSAGAVHSPQVLMCSGIGPAAELKKHDIPVLVDSPAVGQNLQDHLVIQAVAKAPASMSLQHLAIDTDFGMLKELLHWSRTGSGPFAGNVCDTFAFCSANELGAKVDDELSGPTSADLEFISAPVCLAGHAIVPPPSGGYFSIGAVGLRPQSKGTVTLASSSVFDPPIVDANYLATKSDRDLMTFGYKMCRKMAHDKVYKDVFQGWYLPANFDDLDDEAVFEEVKKNCETLYHPAVSCKAGEKIGEAVVDPDLKVFGVDGLRVADASIFPRQIAGHPQWLCMAIGEKLADMIKGTA